MSGALGEMRGERVRGSEAARGVRVLSNTRSQSMSEPLGSPEVLKVVVVVVMGAEVAELPECQRAHCTFCLKMK